MTDEIKRRGVDSWWRSDTVSDLARCPCGGERFRCAGAILCWQCLARTDRPVSDGKPIAFAARGTQGSADVAGERRRAIARMLRDRGGWWTARAIGEPLGSDNRTVYKDIVALGGSVIRCRVSGHCLEYAHVHHAGAAGEAPAPSMKRQRKSTEEVAKARRASVIAAVMKGAKTSEDIRAATGLPPSTTWSTLNEMTSRGDLDRSRRVGRSYTYSIPERDGAAA